MNHELHRGTSHNGSVGLEEAPGLDRLAASQNAGTDAAPVRDGSVDDWMTLGQEGIVYAVDPIVGDSVQIVGKTNAPSGGNLHWYRHLGRGDGTYRWQGPKTVGTGWGKLQHVFSGGEGVIYAVDPIVEESVPMVGKASSRSGGDLHWYRHIGREDGSFRWEGPKVVGRGWGKFKHVFYGGNNIIYAIEPTSDGSVPAVGKATSPAGGRLLWYRHVGRQDGSFQWEGPKVIGRGWGNFKHVFYGGDGIIYAVDPIVEESVPMVGKASSRSGGDLHWYRHIGREDGSFQWEGPKKVGDSWGSLEHVFSGDGVIYAIDPIREASVPMVGKASMRSGGHLYWYRHVGRESGSYLWEGPKKIGDGWGGLNHVFSGDGGSLVRHEVLHGERICDFLDPAGSPTIGIRAYGLKDGHKRSSQLTFSVNGSIPGNNLAQIVQTAFNAWAAATPPAPGLPPALSVAPAGSGSGDIAVSVGALPPSTSGRTSADLTSITISSTFPFSPAGSCSLLATVTHEVGHALGLLHATSTISVMNPGNCSIVTLAPDDVAAVRALYGWPPQRPIPNVGTDSSPALCDCGDSLVMAWKGIGETNLWVSRSYDGVTWTPQARVFGAASTDGPALAWDGSALWMAFRGIAGDDGLYWATCMDSSENFGQAFSVVTPIPGTGSTNGPSITIFNGSPLLVWRGVEGDDGLYYATYNNGAWSGQRPIGGVGSIDRPSVCIDFNGLPRMVWRGVEGDDHLYTSALVGIFWQPQELVQWIVAGNGPAGTVGIDYPGSALGPSATTATPGAQSFTAGGGVVGNVFLVWRGVPGDSGIYFTQGAAGVPGQPPVDWSTQAAIEGVASSHRPGIAVFGARIHIVWKGSGGDHTIWTTSL